MMRRVESEIRLDAAWPLRSSQSPKTVNLSANSEASATPTATTVHAPPPARVVTVPAQPAASSPSVMTSGPEADPNVSQGTPESAPSPINPSAANSVAAPSPPPAPSATPLLLLKPSPSTSASASAATAGPAAVVSSGYAVNNSNKGGTTTTTTTSSQQPAPLSPTTNADERIFEEILDAEVAVSLNKLREAARSLGVPHSLRGTVYRYLLGVASMDKSREMTSERVQEKDVEMLLESFERMWGQNIATTVTGRYRRQSGSREESRKNAAGRSGGVETGHVVTTPYYYGLSLWPAGSSNSATLIRTDESPWANAARTTAVGSLDSFAAWAHEVEALMRQEPFRSDRVRRDKIESAMAALYMTHPDISPEAIHYLVTMALPFETVCHNGRDVFFCAYTLFAVQQMFGNVLQDDVCLQRHCGQFLMLLRDTNLTLYNHFYAQGISTWEWVPSLLVMLFADRHLHPSDLLRLWDRYLSDVWEYVGFPLHPFICLAVLSELTEELVECDREEIIFRLHHLPRLHIPSTIQRALATRESVLSRGLL